MRCESNSYITGSRSLDPFQVSGHNNRLNSIVYYFHLHHNFLFLSLSSANIFGLFQLFSFHYFIVVVVDVGVVVAASIISQITNILNNNVMRKNRIKTMLNKINLPRDGCKKRKQANRGTGEQIDAHTRIHELLNTHARTKQKSCRCEAKWETMKGSEHNIAATAERHKKSEKHKKRLCWSYSF